MYHDDAVEMYHKVTVYVLSMQVIHTVYTVIQEIFVGKIFSWGKSTTKIKRTKIFIR